VKHLIFFLCPNQMNQVSIYRENKSWILVFFIFFKINLQRNNWGPIIKIIRIRTANQNLARVPIYSDFLFSLRPLQPHALLSARVLHAPILANRSPPRVPLRQIKQCWNHSTSLSSTSPLNITIGAFYLLTITFNMSIKHHWTWSWW